MRSASLLMQEFNAYEGVRLMSGNVEGFAIYASVIIDMLGAQPKEPADGRNIWRKQCEDGLVRCRFTDGLN